ncbi:hypothetical protein BDR26DRAFT_856328 [Obelidium mucronatum]|nr:hypothetical protein BDR26DRAFT_856328 [Obelidium mucronatum]
MASTKLRRRQSFLLDAQTSATQGRATEDVARITWYTTGWHSSVIVTGTFDNWSKSVPMVRSDELQAYIADVVLPSSLKSGEKIMYKFVVDGEWKTASEEPVEPDNLGNVNNVFVVTKMTRRTLSPTPSNDSMPCLRPSSISEEESEAESDTTCHNPIPSKEYDQQAIIDLSAFLVENLDAVPFYVDRTKIFHCIESSYMDFKRDSSEFQDPERFSLVLFLLGAARASPWFTERQLAYLRSWTNDLSQKL